MVLNEKEYAIKALKTHEFDEGISSTLCIIAKYLHHVKHKSDIEIIDILDNFMSKVYLDYNKVSWIPMFNYAVKSASKYPLVEIDYIPITQKELDIIDKLTSIQEKRVIFTMLCYAKYYNMINPENNGWVNTDAKIIFKSAHVQMNVEGQYKMLHKLSKQRLIDTSKNMSTLNKQVLFIDNTGKVVLRITDFRDLGYEYLLYTGANYIRCASCGRLTKGNKNNTKKYCNECGKYEAMKTKTVLCIDCGREFLVLSKNNQSERCEECYEIYRKEKVRENVRRYRERNRKKDM